MKTFPRAAALLLPLAALAALLAAGPAQAQARTVAVVPAHVFRGDARNSPLITGALRTRLQEAGFEVLPSERVEATLRSRQIDLSRPQSAATLDALRRALRADYLVYTRVLSVGVGAVSGSYQATLLINSLADPGNTFRHTRQVSQKFELAQRTSADRAVIDADSANEAARRLLEPFLDRERAR